MKRPIFLFWLTIGLFTFQASLQRTGADEPVDGESVLIRNVPHIRQKPDFCGEACAASWLRKLGVDANQDAVFDASGLDPTLGRGCYTKDLAIALRRIGFDTGPVWHSFPAAQHQIHLNKLWQTTLSDLRDGVASIVCMRTSAQAGGSEHFRLVLGYDAATDEVVYHEPAENAGAIPPHASHRITQTLAVEVRSDELVGDPIRDAN